MGGRCYLSLSTRWVEARGQKQEAKWEVKDYYDEERLAKTLTTIKSI